MAGLGTLLHSIYTAYGGYQNYRLFFSLNACFVKALSFTHVSFLFIIEPVVLTDIINL